MLYAMINKYIDIENATWIISFLFARLQIFLTLCYILSFEFLNL